MALRRQIWVAAWQRSWVSTGLRVRASLEPGLGGGGVARGLDGSWGLFRRLSRGLGVGVLDEDVVVVADEVVVVVEVVESEAGERDVGDGGGSWVAGLGVGCWVL